MGCTFKENVSDIRNSKVADVYNELIAFQVHVDVADPLADSNETKYEYGFSLCENIGTEYDAIIVAVGHNAYKDLSEEYFKSLLKDKGILMDIKGQFRNKVKNLRYWSL